MTLQLFSAVSTPRSPCPPGARAIRPGHAGSPAPLGARGVRGALLTPAGSLAGNSCPTCGTPDPPRASPVFPDCRGAGSGIGTGHSRHAWGLTRLEQRHRSRSGPTRPGSEPPSQSSDGSTSDAWLFFTQPVPLLTRANQHTQRFISHLEGS